MMFRVAFGIGLMLCPFIALTDRESLRNLWWIIPIGVVMLIMFGIAFYAIHLEGRGE
jgi:hypothetical protein